MPSSFLLLFPSRLLCGRLKRQLLPWLLLQTHLICFKRKSHFLLPTLPPVCLLQIFTYSGARPSHLHLQGPSWKMQCPLVLPLPFQSRAPQHVLFFIGNMTWESWKEDFRLKGAGVYKQWHDFYFFFSNIVGRIQCKKAQKRGALDTKSENDTCCSLSEEVCQGRLISHVHLQSFQAMVFFTSETLILMCF